MNIELFSKVALKIDLVDYHLQKGDVAVIIEKHPEVNGITGVTLEVFNALGETIAVPTILESQIEPLNSNEILHVRPLNINRVAERGENYFQ
jgi:hypothetical protein